MPLGYRYSDLWFDWIIYILNLRFLNLESRFSNLVFWIPNRTWAFWAFVLYQKSGRCVIVLRLHGMKGMDIYQIIDDLSVFFFSLFYSVLVLTSTWFFKTNALLGVVSIIYSINSTDIIIFFIFHVIFIWYHLLFGGTFAIQRVIS